MRASRVLDTYDSIESFAGAAQAAIKPFAFERKITSDGATLLRPPGHSEEFEVQDAKRAWRPFRAKHMALEGYEAPVIGLLSFLLRTFPISTFYDVGARTGYFSFFTASTEGKDIKTHAFEMAPPWHEKMLQLMARKPHIAGRIEAHLSGLSDTHEGVRPIWYSRTQMFEKKPAPSEYREAWHRRLKFAFKGITDRDELKIASVLLTSIDAFCATHEPPDCIKIDVDGYEGKILKGAEQTLTAERPFILLELHQDNHIERTGWNRRSVVQFLFDLGYSALYLTNHHNVQHAELIKMVPGSAVIDKQTTSMFLFI